MHDTLPLLEVTDFPYISRGTLQTLQVNLGYKCNQRCTHCHVSAGPHRKEMMDRRTISLIPKVLAARNISQLDLTGGAPEMHEDFRYLVAAASSMGVNVIDRCNLTILNEPGYQDLDRFMAKHRVEIIASLPAYTSDVVDSQRGKGVFESSIEALLKLNALGYGKEGSGLVLNLVYNPPGPTLPPEQIALEAKYKEQLGSQFSIEFNKLYTLANMPINRFGSMLVSKNQFGSYMKLLKDNYQAENLAEVMCKGLISVDWQGRIYDCDFNQQLQLKSKGGLHHLRDLLEKNPEGNPIVIADHCFGCTAGQGSSCGGAL